MFTSTSKKHKPQTN